MPHRVLQRQVQGHVVQGEQENGAVHGHGQNLRQGVESTGIGHVVQEVVKRGAGPEEQEESADDGERHQILQIRYEAQGAGERKDYDDVDARVHLETREKFYHLEIPQGTKYMRYATPTLLSLNRRYPRLRRRDE